MTFGEKLKLIRKKFGLSQNEFANLFHLSRKTVSAWENNRSKPDQTIINEISKMFNIQQSILLNQNLSSRIFLFWINQKHKYIIYVISIIQMILIIGEYFTLVNTFNIVLNSIALIIITIIIKHLSYPFLYLKPHKSTLVILLTINTFCGFLTLFESIDQINITNSFFYGSIFGKIAIIILLTYAIYVLLLFLKIIKKILKKENIN